MPAAAQVDPPSPTAEVTHLSCLLRSPVLDPGGHRVGRLDDVIVRLGEGGHPPVSGLVVGIGRQARFVRISDVRRLSPDGVTLGVAPDRLGPFERRPGEVLLSRDLSARHLIHLQGARLVRANEIELACIGGRWEVVGVDPSSRPVLRRLLPRSMRGKVRSGGVVDWADIEPFVSHVPTARLRIPYRKLAKLHPAQLADLVEAASHDEGEEIIEAVGADQALEADVFEELDPDHQVEFLRDRSDDEAARILAAMEPDDAADLLNEMDQKRRLPILQRLPDPSGRKVRALLNYHPETAGGLMNNDFVTVGADTTAATALEVVKTSPVSPEAAGVIFVTEAQGRLVGTVLLLELLRAEASARVGGVARPDPLTLPPDADVHEVVRKMTDFNLAVAPVVDEQGRMLGQITVDDVLELLLPTGWRRQYGMSSVD